MTYVTKGSKITARWFKATLLSFAGVTMKTGAEEIIITGTVRHVRGDHPTDPKTVRLYVEVESGSEVGLGTPCGKCQVREVEVDPIHVVAVTASSVSAGFA